MAGIYFHIPFCSKACHYCNFHFSTSLHRKAELVQAMVKEVQAFAAKQEYKRKASTLYFGGGTPSILTASEISALLAAAGHAFTLDDEAEITMEVNPGDCVPENLLAWKQAGINRLSIGIQSFYQPHLQWMNRSHHSGQSIQAIDLAANTGFQNISIDLIFGLPQQSNQEWIDQLNMAFSMPVQHISAYALTVEEGTALHHFIQKKKVAPPLENAQAEQFLLLQRMMQTMGWDAYEISNYCTPGYRSRHNTGYWKGLPYFGFGPSAHSFDGLKTRRWNVANNALYISALTDNLAFYEQETLTDIQLLNERIMTGLRRSEGIQFNQATLEIEGVPVSKQRWQTFFEQAMDYVDKHLIENNNGKINLTEQGKLYADGISAGLFVSA